MSVRIADFVPPAQYLDGRVVVITGAGAGLGRAAALAASAAGATCVLLGRTLNKLEAVYDAIEDAGYPRPAIFPINFESAVEEDYRQLAAVLQTEFGRVDGLLHSAAILGARSPLSQYSERDWQRVLAVNLTAPFMLTRALLPLLRNSPAGRVVFNTAAPGEQGRAYWGAYGVAAAGVENLMQTLADELDETTMAVAAFDPGPARTGLRAEAYPGEDPNSVPSPESLANRYVYLLGPAAADWHGQRLTAAS